MLHVVGHETQRLNGLKVRIFKVGFQITNNSYFHLIE